MTKKDGPNEAQKGRPKMAQDDREEKQKQTIAFQFDSNIIFPIQIKTRELEFLLYVRYFKKVRQVEFLFCGIFFSDCFFPS